VNEMLKQTAIYALAGSAPESKIPMTVKMEVKAGSQYVRGIPVSEEGRGARLPNTDGREDRVLGGSRSKLEAKLVGVLSNLGFE